MDSSPPTQGSGAIDRDLVRQLDRARTEIAELRAALLATEGELTTFRQLEADMGELCHEMEQMKELDTELDASRAELERVRQEAGAAAARLAEMTADRDRWYAQFAVVADSTSWRITAPLRRAMAALRAERR